MRQSNARRDALSFHGRIRRLRGQFGWGPRRIARALGVLQSSVENHIYGKCRCDVAAKTERRRARIRPLDWRRDTKRQCLACRQRLAMEEYSSPVEEIKPKWPICLNCREQGWVFQGGYLFVNRGRAGKRRGYSGRDYRPDVRQALVARNAEKRRHRRLDPVWRSDELATQRTKNAARYRARVGRLQRNSRCGVCRVAGHNMRSCPTCPKNWPVLPFGTKSTIAINPIVGELLSGQIRPKMGEGRVCRVCRLKDHGFDFRTTDQILAAAS